MLGVYLKLYTWLRSHKKKQTAVMNYVSKFLSNFKEFYNEINSATLTGAIDVVVIKQEDGSYTCSPFHVRFGKIGVLRSREKIVDIEINGEPVDIHMKLGETGEAFFVEETKEHDDVPSHLATSPIPSFPDIEKELAKIHSATKVEHPFDPGPQIILASNNGPTSDNKDVFITLEDTEENISLQGSIYHEVSETVNSCQSGKETSTLILDTSSEIPTDITIESSNINELGDAGNVPTDYVVEITTKTETINLSDIPTDDIVSNVEDTAKVKLSTSSPIMSIEEAQLSSTVPLVSPIKSSDILTKTESTNGLCDKSLQFQTSVNALLPSPTSSFIPIVNGTKSSTSMQDEATLVQTHLSDNSIAAGNLSPDVVYVEHPSSNIDEDKSKKKKRRKRSIIRKRKSRETQESSDEEEEIFQMDVDDDMENQRRQVPFKPQVNYKSNIPSIKNMSSSLDRGMENVPNSFFDSSFKNNFPSTSDGISHSWQYNSTLQLNFESHPFSDGDVTPVLSPVSSRPPTPKSDTEYEILKHETASQTDAGENRWSWTWGELPVPPKSNNEVKREPPVTDDESLQTKKLEADEDEQRSMLGGMFRFMRKTKKLRHQPETEGIYLDDLNLDELDPEIAKLYFPPRNSNFRIQSSAIEAPSRAKDEDVESGNGSSLPQSPQSVEGCMSGIHATDSDNDEQHHMFEFKGYHDLAISICGGLAEYNGEIPHERFMHSLVTYDEFCENPTILNHPDAVVRFNNKYYNWQTVAPLVMAMLLYQRPLSDKTVDKLIEDCMPKKPKKTEAKSYSSWFYWRRSSTVENVNKKADDKKKENEIKLEVPEIKPNENDTDLSSKAELDKNADIRRKEESAYASMSSETEDIANTLDEATENKQIKLLNKTLSLKGTEKFKKTLRLTSEQISKLNLQQGPNEVVFSVTTAFQGTTQCKCHIYLWNYDDKVVISDIDGTITKSDVLGHILPIIGKDWAQSGVAQLFTKIKNNGYQFLYLSSRAIGQAHVTREYLKSIRQNDLCLPEGPLLLNPSSLISAFHREVIEKKPEEFKISCLKDIQMLFPNSTNPFYAGYGNRVNDVWAYRAVGVPMTRIFTINHKGELKHELTHSFQSTYTGLSSVVDHLFPPLKRTVAADGHLTTDFEGSDEFSSFTYWRPPFPEVSFEAIDTKKATPNKKSTKGKT